MARPLALSPDQQQQLRNRALGCPALSPSELAEWVELALGVRVSTRTIYRVLPRLGLRLLRNGRWVEGQR